MICGSASRSPVVPIDLEGNTITSTTPTCLVRAKADAKDRQTIRVRPVSIFFGTSSRNSVAEPAVVDAFADLDPLAHVVHDPNRRQTRFGGTGAEVLAGYLAGVGHAEVPSADQGCPARSQYAMDLVHLLFPFAPDQHGAHTGDQVVRGFLEWQGIERTRSGRKSARLALPP